VGGGTGGATPFGGGRTRGRTGPAAEQSQPAPPKDPAGTIKPSEAGHEQLPAARYLRRGDGQNAGTAAVPPRPQSAKKSAAARAPARTGLGPQPRKSSISKKKTQGINFQAHYPDPRVRSISPSPHHVPICVLTLLLSPIQQSITILNPENHI